MKPKLYCIAYSYFVSLSDDRMHILIDNKFRDGSKNFHYFSLSVFSFYYLKEIKWNLKILMFKTILKEKRARICKPSRHIIILRTFRPSQDCWKPFVKSLKSCGSRHHTSIMILSIFALRGRSFQFSSKPGGGSLVAVLWLSIVANSTKQTWKINWNWNDAQSYANIYCHWQNGSASPT